ncbi:MAG: pentapeptide repeat-containing protein, partial [Nocardioides sp.]
ESAIAAAESFVGTATLHGESPDSAFELSLRVVTPGEWEFITADGDVVPLSVEVSEVPSKHFSPDSVILWATITSDTTRAVGNKPEAEEGLLAGRVVALDDDIESDEAESSRAESVGDGGFKAVLPGEWRFTETAAPTWEAGTTPSRDETRAMIARPPLADAELSADELRAVLGFADNGLNVEATAAALGSHPATVAGHLDLVAMRLQPPMTVSRFRQWIAETLQRPVLAAPSWPVVERAAYRVLAGYSEIADAALPEGNIRQLARWAATDFETSAPRVAEVRSVAAKLGYLDSHQIGGLALRLRNACRLDKRVHRASPAWRADLARLIGGDSPTRIEATELAGQGLLSPNVDTWVFTVGDEVAAAARVRRIRAGMWAPSRMRVEGFWRASEIDQADVSSGLGEHLDQVAVDADGAGTWWIEHVRLAGVSDEQLGEFFAHLLPTYGARRSAEAELRLEANDPQRLLVGFSREGDLIGIVSLSLHPGGAVGDSYRTPPATRVEHAWLLPDRVWSPAGNPQETDPDQADPDQADPDLLEVAVSEAVILACLDLIDDPDFTAEDRLDTSGLDSTARTLDLLQRISESTPTGRRIRVTTVIADWAANLDLTRAVRSMAMKGGLDLIFDHELEKLWLSEQRVSLRPDARGARMTSSWSLLDWARSGLLADDPQSRTLRVPAAVGQWLACPLSVEAALSGLAVRGVSLARLTSCNLRGLDLSGVDLRGVNLALLDLTGANLRDALLDGADLRHAIRDDADFTGASLRGALGVADLRTERQLNDLLAEGGGAPRDDGDVDLDDDAGFAQSVGEPGSAEDGTRVLPVPEVGSLVAVNVGGTPLAELVRGQQGEPVAADVDLVAGG